MAEPVNREQALTVLCDLALAAGGEVTVAALLIKTLQRFLYHTGFPVGLVFSDEQAGGDRVDACLEVAIGDYRLARRQGERMPLPAALLPPAPALVESGETLAALGTHRPAGAALTLPIEGFGHIVLVGRSRPATNLPLTELFVPVTAHLATTITLCRAYEREVQRRIEFNAHYDQLTGLPNAASFAAALREALQRSRQTGEALAVCYLDLDDFIAFNERYGRESGDQLLIGFARHLTEKIRPGDVCGRLMGDEFALLLTGLSARQEVADRLSEALCRVTLPIDKTGVTTTTVTATIGVAVCPTDSQEADLLLRYAQMAMHEAKQSARGSFRLFDAEQDRLAHQRRSLLQRVGDALVNREFVLHYQPKVDMVTGRLVGVEALLRWNDPAGGQRLPGEFLPVVEGSDLITAIGEWVMAEALEQSVRWRRQGLALPVSVNVASRHLQEPTFVDRLRCLFAAQPAAVPSDLEIEILETSAIQDFAHARAVIEECRRIGIGVSLDDFGTGYSSLAYLSQLPATVIKIDQLFIRRLFEQQQDPAIIRAIVQIAQVFGCQVIAEGVEDVEHGMALLAMGCRLAQGFGIARPMPAVAVAPWVRAYRTHPEWRRAPSAGWTPELYELLRTRHLHRLWRDRVLQHLGDGLPAEALPADARVDALSDRDDPAPHLNRVRDAQARLAAALANLGAAPRAGVAAEAAGAFDRFLAALDEMIYGA